MNPYASIRQEIANFLNKNYNIALDSIAPDATLEDVGIDSLGVLGIATLLENKFGLTLETGLMVQARTFSDLMDLVKAKAAKLA
jgi:acyl carrier protein